MYFATASSVKVSSCLQPQTVRIVRLESRPRYFLKPGKLHSKVVLTCFQCTANSTWPLDTFGGLDQSLHLQRLRQDLRRCLCELKVQIPLQAVSLTCCLSNCRKLLLLHSEAEMLKSEFDHGFDHFESIPKPQVEIVFQSPLECSVFEACVLDFSWRLNDIWHIW